MPGIEVHKKKLNKIMSRLTGVRGLEFEFGYFVLIFVSVTV